MTIHLHQLDSRPILHYQFEGHITLHDLMALEAAERALFSSLPDESHFHVIADMCGIETIAAPLFPKLQQMRMVRDHRVQWIAVVGANPYLRALAKSLGMTVHRPNLVFCATVDEALAVLAPEDAAPLAPSATDSSHEGKVT